ncbi:hypothetical protein GCM10009733_070100 [Nonomuraea maheshkhaliensis]|uniref:Uncharacterized protein n=1 Tax=Nonomuraea maheshkhaliensis TaxID=419590 RepID=A0ABN2G062_9ACTN
MRRFIGGSLPSAAPGRAAAACSGAGVRAGGREECNRAASREEDVFRAVEEGAGEAGGFRAEKILPREISRSVARRPDACEGD